MKTKNKLYLVGFLALLLVLLALFAPYLTPYDANAQDLTQSLQAPDGSHWLGTDRYGRDLFSRVLVGARLSILATLVLVALNALVGLSVGLLCGYQGGRLDTLLMRVTEVFLAFPGLIFAIALAGVLGGGVVNAVLSILVVAWAKYARLTRTEVLRVRNATFMQAARLSGCSWHQLIFRHLLPNISSIILITAMLDIGTMMMELAGLSFLGFGAAPPAAEWGSMMSAGRSQIQTAPWLILAPGSAIFLTVLVFNLLGDTLRDYLDPRQRPAAK